MKVLLTGAAGRLGSETCKALVQAGYEVRATDRRANRDLPVRIEVANLVDRYVCYHLIEGVDAVVHLANYPSAWSAEPQTVFNDNCTMNMNIFQAAAELGIKKMVFASSLQTLIGDRRYRDGEQEPSGLAYLPADGDMPVNLGNHYAVSKRASELLLEYFCRYRKMESCVAIRFPMLLGGHALQWARRQRDGHLDGGVMLDEAFSYLIMEDAARLVAACLRTPLPGFRIYYPSARRPRINMPVKEIIAKFFPNVPLRRPVEEMTGLVDISRIVKETGWEPKLDLDEQ